MRAVIKPVIHYDSCYEFSMLVTLMMTFEINSALRLSL